MNVLPMPFLDLPLYHGTGESSIFPTGYETACWCLRPLDHAFPPKISRISWNRKSHMSAYRISSNDCSTCYDTVRGRKRPPSGAGGAEEGRYRQVAALWAFVIAARKPTYVKTSWLWDKTVLLSAYWSIEPLLQCYSTACPGLDVKHTETQAVYPVWPWRALVSVYISWWFRRRAENSRETLHVLCCCIAYATSQQRRVSGVRHWHSLVRRDISGTLGGRNFLQGSVFFFKTNRNRHMWCLRNQWRRFWQKLNICM
jgi:hypothetical protein